MDEQQQTPPPTDTPPPSPYVRPDYASAGTMAMPGQDERTQAMLCWILSIFAGFIPGLIFYLIANDKPFVKRQGALALTMSIITIIGMFASAILMIVLIGLVTYFLFAIWMLVVCIMGAIACNKGENFSPKYVSELCYKMFKL